MRNFSNQPLSNRTLLEIVSLFSDATAIYTGEDLVIELANEKMIGFWGKDKAVVGMPLIKALPELEGQEFIPLLQNVWRTGVAYEAVETPAMININGSIKTFYFDFVYRPIFNENGQIICIFNTAIDVTARVNFDNQFKKQATENVRLNQKLLDTNQNLRVAVDELKDMHQERNVLYNQLAESEELFREIFNQAPIGLTWLKGPEMIVEQANQPILEIWGRSAAEVIGKPIRTGRPELEGQTVLEKLQKVYEKGEIQVNAEYKVLLKDGDKLREAYVNSVYSPLRGEDGQVKGILAVVDDVTERVAERRQSKLMEEQFRISVESAELGTWLVDAETREFITSPRLRELFGFDTARQITLNDAVNQVPEDYRPLVIKAIDAAIENETNYDIEYPVIGFQDQKLRWVRATGKLYPAEHGAKPHFSGVLTDITDRKLEESRKFDFIAIASHELKTPLTSAKGYVQMMLSKARSGKDEFAQRALEKVERQIEKMTTLIKGFLDVSRLESGQIRLDKSLFDLADVIAECVDEARVFSNGHEIVVNSKSQELYADKEKIGQVITNFLSNALKYSPHGGQIILNLKSDRTFLFIEIKDQGIGISTQDRQKLFERFYRVDNMHTKTISGFGIGLYLCAEIIRLHDGEIGVESELGQGSTFFFKLPL